jgi:hypothetical protein
MSGVEAEIRRRLERGDTPTAILASGYARSTVYKVAGRFADEAADGRLTASLLRRAERDLRKAHGYIGAAERNLAIIREARR